MSFMNYWTAYCTKYEINPDAFGAELNERWKNWKEIFHEELMIFSGFGSFMVMFPRKRTQAHNSVGHARRAIGAIKNFYKKLNGREPGVAQVVASGT